MNEMLPTAGPPFLTDNDLAMTLARRLDASARQVDIGGDTGNGLVKLVLALLNVIHELLERQAMRRIDGGSLSDVQSEGLGAALMGQARVIRELCDQLGITEEDLAIDLGPLGHLGD
jgi:hypothetical protein